MVVRIGSRGSRLALTQAELAAAILRAAGHQIAFVPITTAGDRDRKSPFGEIGERADRERPRVIRRARQPRAEPERERRRRQLTRERHRPAGQDRIARLTARADAGRARSVGCPRGRAPDRVRADHDRGRPRPKEPVRADRGARRLRQGDRGGAARGPIDALEADFVPLYSTVLLEPEPPEGDVVVLASGSAARAYSFIGGAAPAISIGPETTRVAGSLGISVVGEATTHDLDGLVAAVAEYAASR